MKNNGKKSGIYLITNIMNDKIYVGKAEDIDDSWKKYIPYPELYKDESIELYNDMMKYGWDCFYFEPIEFCDMNKLDKRREHWILTLHTDSSGYNKNYKNDGLVDIRVYCKDGYKMKNLGYKQMWFSEDEGRFSFSNDYYKLVKFEDYDKEIEKLKNIEY